MMNEAIDIIVTAVLALISLVLTGVIIPWIKSKTTASQRDALKRLVDEGVRAAEQVFGRPGFGEEKKEYVYSWLEKLGIKREDVDELIETAVFELKREIAQ